MRADVIFTIMFVWKKEVEKEKIKETKPFCMFVNSRPDSHYTDRRMPTEKLESTFKEKTKRAIKKNIVFFSDLKDGYVFVVRHIRYDQIHKYSVPHYYISFNNGHEDERLFEDDVKADTKKINSIDYENGKIREARKKKNTMHGKYEQARRNKAKSKKDKTSA